jgi:hypothetical protein
MLRNPLSDPADDKLTMLGQQPWLNILDDASVLCRKHLDDLQRMMKEPELDKPSNLMPEQRLHKLHQQLLAKLALYQGLKSSKQLSSDLDIVMTDSYADRHPNSVDSQHHSIDSKNLVHNNLGRKEDAPKYWSDRQRELLDKVRSNDQLFSQVEFEMDRLQESTARLQSSVSIFHQHQQELASIYQVIYHVIAAISC